MWMMRSVLSQNESLLRSFYGVALMRFYLVLVQGTESGESVALCPDQRIDHSGITRVNSMEGYIVSKGRTFFMFQIKIKDYFQKHKSILKVSTLHITGGIDNSM